MSHASNASSHKSAGSASKDASRSGTRNAQLGFSACAFWLGPRRFGLDVSLVGEVTQVESLTRVPLAHPALIGLFNLRGLPVPAVELTRVLGFEDLERNVGKTQTSLLLRWGDLIAGVLIDRMDAVIPSGVGLFTTPAADDEHPLVVGFLEGSEVGDVITVLDSTGLIDRLRQVGFDRVREG